MADEKSVHSIPDAAKKDADEPCICAFLADSLIPALGMVSSDMEHRTDGMFTCSAIVGAQLGPVVGDAKAQGSSDTQCTRENVQHTTLMFIDVLAVGSRLSEVDMNATRRARNRLLSMQWPMLLSHAHKVLTGKEVSSRLFYRVSGAPEYYADRAVLPHNLWDEDYSALIPRVRDIMQESVDEMKKSGKSITEHNRGMVGGA